MTDYGLPFVEVHQGCPHLETKWVRCHDCERKRCLRCGGLLPTRLGVRHTAGKRKKLARERRREAARVNAVRSAQAAAAVQNVFQRAAVAIGELASAVAGVRIPKQNRAAPPL